MNQHHTAHLLQGKKAVGKFASSWSHLSLHNLLCRTLYLPFLLLSLYPAYLFSHHSVLLSNITLCLCPLSAFHPFQPLNFSTSPIHSILFISSVVLSLSFLFTSFSLYLQGDTSVLKMGWPPLWYSKQSEDIARSKCVLILCCHLCLLILSVSWTTLVFSPVFHCMGKRSTVK